MTNMPLSFTIVATDFIKTIPPEVAQFQTSWAENIQWAEISISNGLHLI
jgi:hypothetical protein